MNNLTPFNQKEVRIILAKYKAYTGSEAIWNGYISKLKHQLYLFSHEVLRILEVSNWEEVIQIAEQTYKEHPAVQGLETSTQIDATFTKEMNKILLLKRLEPYKEQLNIPSTEYTRLIQKMALEDVTLPSLSTIYRLFDTWDNLKDVLGVEKTPRKKQSNSGLRKRYTYQEVIQMLEEHGKHLTSRTDWDLYAREHNLLSYASLLNYLTPGELNRYAQYEPRKKWSVETIHEALIQHLTEFKTLSTREWNEYAKSNQLPSYSTIKRYLKMDEIKKIQSN